MLREQNDHHYVNKNYRNKKKILTFRHCSHQRPMPDAGLNDIVDLHIIGRGPCRATPGKPACRI